MNQTIFKSIVPLAIIIVLFLSAFKDASKTRTFNVNGKDVKVLIPNDAQFIGKYKGSKSGFLVLNADGTGEFKYDYAYNENACPDKSFDIEWGLILESDGMPLKFEREYGYSYPVILKSQSGNHFEGCTEKILVDYLLVKKDGVHVSSSDDWKK
ncbi:hypothetical protein [Aureibacter tunicatorum]|uniref:Uncharacterized protein n=1 Tax=Aureibacter tunicatorum TaxID=866807 RepID=A0AAE3XKZ6_9BACT|nr:hypothetical protein [Aureibacter tunicatorum]MDR6238357.1 hypothetical protein [Aureibacter tunicatorum]BDD03389.1 hypothetical protein AUTU_08720 [Aureibacter tunicatorum]